MSKSDNNESSDNMRHSKVAVVIIPDGVPIGLPAAGPGGAAAFFFAVVAGKRGQVLSLLYPFGTLERV